MPKRVKKYGMNGASLFGLVANGADIGGGGSPSQNNPAGGDNNPDDKPDGDKPDGDKPDGDKLDGDKTDWKTRFEAQKAVTKNLEATVNQMKDGMKAALGITDKKTDSSELLLQMQTQIDELRKENIVAKVALEYRITDAADLETLSLIPSEEAMRKLAARLAPQDENDGSAAPTTTPKNKLRPDPSAGRGGDRSTGPAGAKARSVQDAMRDHLKELQAKDPKLSGLSIS